jgi:hypothetical protein
MQPWLLYFIHFPLPLEQRCSFFGIKGFHDLTRMVGGEQVREKEGREEEKKEREGERKEGRKREVRFIVWHRLKTGLISYLYHLPHATTIHISTPFLPPKLDLWNKGRIMVFMCTCSPQHPAHSRPSVQLPINEFMKEWISKCKQNGKTGSKLWILDFCMFQNARHKASAP